MSSDTYIVFELAGTFYGVASHEVQHIELVDQITPVPNAPPQVEGVFYSRGHVIPAINLRVRFGLPWVPPTLRSRLIIVQSGERRVGWLVDAAREFRRIPAEVVQAPEAALGCGGGGAGEKYVRGIAFMGERLIVILDTSEVIKFGASAPDLADPGKRLLPTAA